MSQVATYNDDITIIKQSLTKESAHFGKYTLDFRRIRKGYEFTKTIRILDCNFACMRTVSR